MTRLKKRLGQHFLHEHAYIERIVDAIDPRPGDRLVEIGPGAGALTLPLLTVAGDLTVIELDRDLVEPLRAAAGDAGHLNIVHADVLKVDFAALPGAGQLRIVGNLPYYISSPILFHCLDHVDRIADMHFMLQKEVVERMAATPGGRIYGRLSVMLQLACRVERVLEVPAEAFSPPPKVDSALVRLVPLPSEKRPNVDAAAVHAVVKAAFAQRRKTLRNALRKHLEAESIRAVGIDPGARAEALAPGDFVRLAQRWRKSAACPPEPRHGQSSHE